MTSHYYESSSRFIPAHWHPGVFIDLVRQHGICENKLLRGTGIFLDDITHTTTLISVQQFTHIIDNAHHLLPKQDITFRYGNRLFPGNFDQCSTALNYADNLWDALQFIQCYPLSVYPLLRANLIETTDEVAIEWQDVFGLGNKKIQAVEIACAAMVSFSNWQNGDQLPWRFEFDYAPPDYLEQYEVHLADMLYTQSTHSRIKFNRAACRMWVDRKYLFTPWRYASSTVSQFAKNELANNRDHVVQQGFCGLVKAIIEQALPSSIYLHSVAEALQLSPATLKRKLKNHNTTFQQLLDNVRRKKSVDLMLKSSYNQEQIAHFLGIQDSANFRRSFKTWTGFSPGEFLQIQL